MVTIRTYPADIEAQLDRARLEAEGIPAVVVGVGVVLEGGMSGVKLKVSDEDAERALEVLRQEPPEPEDEYERPSE